MAENAFLKEVAEKKYEYGFETEVDTEILEKGLSEDVVRLISRKKGEPAWLLDFRLEAFRYWQSQKQPSWGHLTLPEIDYQAISYYADPTRKSATDGGSKEIDPELMKTFDKLGIPLEERLALSGTAVDAVMDSVSVKTTFRERLAEKGIIFCSISEAVKEHPDLVRTHLGSVVPYRDNYFAALNSAVFSDGSFVYIPTPTSPIWRAARRPCATRTSSTPPSWRSWWGPEPRRNTPRCKTGIPATARAAAAS